MPSKTRGRGQTKGRGKTQRQQGGELSEYERDKEMYRKEQERIRLNREAKMRAAGLLPPEKKSMFSMFSSSPQRSRGKTRTKGRGKTRGRTQRRA